MDLTEAKRRLCGSIVPLVTPFTPENEIDQLALKSRIEGRLDCGTHGISTTGATGEPSALWLPEREQVVALVVEMTMGRSPVLAGTGTNNPDEALPCTRYAEAAGADREVAAVNLEPEALARLADDGPNIVGVKEADPNLQIVHLLGPRFLVDSGSEPLCFPMLTLGGAGHVAATVHAMPKEVADLYDLAVEGRWEEARALHDRLSPLNGALFLETNPGPSKTALGWMGKVRPRLRPPLAPPSTDRAAKRRSATVDLGLLPEDEGTAA